MCRLTHREKSTGAPQLGCVVTLGCGNGEGGGNEGCANGIRHCKEALTDLGQIARGEITRGCDSEEFDDKGGTYYRCDKQACAFTQEASV